MNIFITGISGVLGSTLKTYLRNTGHNVWGCDLMHSEDPQIVRADVSQIRQFERALLMAEDDIGEIDTMFHFAAEFGRKNGRDYYEQLWNTNCIGTRNAIELCLDFEKRLIFSSSSEAYGLSEEYSNGEKLSEGMLDIHPPQFHNEYALSKYTNERQIQTAARNNGLNAIILRFFNIYGPPEEFSPYRSVVCQFIYKLLAGEEVTVNRGGKRAHLWIGDWVQTVARLADPRVLENLENTRYYPGAARVADLPVFNIGGTQYESIDELFKSILVAAAETLGSDGFPIPRVTFVGEEEENCATKEPDNNAARLFLSHNPQTLLHNGLVETIKWTKERYGF